MLSENDSIIVDGRCTIRNESRERDDDAHSVSIAVFPTIFGDVFAINASDLE